MTNSELPTAVFGHGNPAFGSTKAPLSPRHWPWPFPGSADDRVRPWPAPKTGAQVYVSLGRSAAQRPWVPAGKGEAELGFPPV
jgi:hypothetical protein